MRKLTWAGLTDVGRKRTGNEDAFVVVPELGLYVVCDGMGGHASGEVASAMTTEEIATFYDNRNNGDRSLPYQGEPGATAGELVASNAIQHANDKVYVAGMRDSKLEGMGTTVVAISEWEDQLILAHVGDSRIYRFRDGKLEQVTRDHSLLNHKIDLGELTTQEEIDNFKHGNVIVRAIGLKDYVRPETAIHERVPGDLFVLCSDGLSDMVDDWSIENVIEANYDDLEEAVQILIRMANDRGGKDNITAVLVRVDDEPQEEVDDRWVVGDEVGGEDIAEEAYQVDEDEEYDDYIDEGDDTVHDLNRFATVPTLQAYRDEEHAEIEPRVLDNFKDISDPADEQTAPHSPVFSWDDDEDEDEFAPVARPQPSKKRTATKPQQDLRRRLQSTQDLPAVIVDDDDDEPSIVVDDSLMD